MLFIVALPIYILNPESSFRVRYRIDGKMVQVRSIHKEYWSAISVRIKIMSAMNIAETRKSQDGRINSEILVVKLIFVFPRNQQFMAKILSCVFLDENNLLFLLDKLGFSNHSLKTITRLVQGQKES